MIFSSVLVLIYVRLRPILSSLRTIDNAYPLFFLRSIALCGAFECIKRIWVFVKRKRDEATGCRSGEQDNNTTERIEPGAVDIIFRKAAISIVFSIAVCSHVALFASFFMPAPVVWNFLKLLKSIYAPLILLGYILYRAHRAVAEPEQTEPEPKRWFGPFTKIVQSATILYDTYHDTYLKFRPPPSSARV